MILIQLFLKSIFWYLTNMQALTTIFLIGIVGAVLFHIAESMIFNAQVVIQTGKAIFESYKNKKHFSIF